MGFCHVPFKEEVWEVVQALALGRAPAVCCDSPRSVSGGRKLRLWKLKVYKRSLEASPFPNGSPKERRVKRKINTGPCWIPEDTGDEKGMEVQPAHAVKVRSFPLLEETHGPHRLPPAEAGSEQGMEVCPILKRKKCTWHNFHADWHRMEQNTGKHRAPCRGFGHPCSARLPG